ncbi:MAG: tRNA (adenosine(37)-N6)-dimethylallyltransferase MiaA [Vicingaceae bacterium]
MPLIIILGPTAVGKTKLAVQVAAKLDGEIISADSRQVYKGMDIGTGKDLEEFTVDGKEIPHHLIDIKEAGEQYHLYDFQQDFYAAYRDICSRGKTPILCGGTGLYLEAALAKEQLLKVSKNEKLRKELGSANIEELNRILLQLNPNQHNKTDLGDRERCIRAIEIETLKQQEPTTQLSPVRECVIFGICQKRSALRARIEERLNHRLENGMVEEVEQLLQSGLSAEQLDYYGLEYRFISKYLKQELSYEEMVAKLLQAIRRFAKKQMTWYRRMERKGEKIHWLDANKSSADKLSFVLNHI